MAFNFEGLAAALLPRAAELVAAWFPNGKRSGHEWLIGNVAGDAGESFSINLDTGRWADFAGDELKGGDLVSLYAAQHNLTQLQSARALARQIGFTLNGSNGAGEHPKAAPAAPTLLKPPSDAPSLPDHPTHGAAALTHAYRDLTGALLFYVARYNTPDGKEYRPWTWDGSHWRQKAAPTPRPLYGLEHLAARKSDAPILIVEGERCADAAAAVLPQYVTLTWCGGAKATGSADLSPLKGRRVDLWPDADTPGRQAMARLGALLIELGCTIRTFSPDDAPEGWDIADAVAEGWDAARILGWAKSHVQAPASSAKPAPVPAAPSALIIWQQCGISTAGRANSGGVPHATESNVALLVAHHPLTTGTIWYDTFRDRVYMTERNAREREWTDQDTLAFLDWCQGELQLHKLTRARIHDGVLIAALRSKKSSVGTWLDSLQWDGTERRETWLHAFFGAPDDEHHRALGSNWLVAMVARALNPGCQVDNMVILEGGSGAGKSKALEIIGGKWYASLAQRFGSEKFIEAMQGYWLIEIPDMAGFAGADHLRVLADITRRTDTYRIPWDRLASEHPRRCVLTASTESRAEYLRDTFGTRRFWSVSCGDDIDLDGLRAARDQLFAEAVKCYRAGASWHFMPEQTRTEQLTRVEQDIYHDKLQRFLSARTETTPLEVYEAVFAERDNYGQIRRSAEDKDKKRIAKSLRRLGWLPLQLWRDGEKVNGWVAPRPPFQ